MSTVLKSLADELQQTYPQLDIEYAEMPTPGQKTSVIDIKGGGHSILITHEEGSYLRLNKQIIDDGHVDLNDPKSIEFIVAEIKRHFQR